MRTSNELILYRRLAEALTAVINSRPEGSSADRLYEALAPHCSREEFDHLMVTLEAGGRVSRKGALFLPAKT